MANTFDFISSVSITTNTAAIDFTSIPSTYKDIKIIFSARTNAGGSRDDIYFRVNGQTGSGYYYQRLFGIDNTVSAQTGSNVTAVSQVIGSVPAAGGTGPSGLNTFGTSEIYIPDYANTSYQKSMLCWWSAPNYNTLAYVLGVSGSGYNTTSAISSFAILSTAGNSFISGSTAYLYGIKNT